MVAIFLVVAVLLIAVGGLLAAADAALTVSSRIDLVELAATARSRRSILAIAADIGTHLNAVNFMRVVSETTAAVLVTLAFASVFPDAWWWSLLVSALIMIGASFVLVGSSPRSVGRAHARGVLAFAAPVIHGGRVVLGPLANALVALGDRVTPGTNRTATFSSEEQLLSMVDEATELDVLEEDDRELIHSIFEFNDTVVRAVMVPRPDMIVVEQDATVGDALDLLLERGVSRAPVVGDDLDTVHGIAYLKDLIRRDPAGRVVAVVRPALFAPESQKADDLLRIMQRDANHLAMVVDEYGAIAGLVTMEDLIEELVGDISDEYDREVVEQEEVEPGVFRVSARLPVDELGDLFDLELDDDDVDSVGGLLSKALGRLPARGDEATASGLVLRAERIERRRVVSVIVHRGPELTDAEAAFAAEREETA
ncbi:hemolysin family protein [Galbitalea sp. SE-J8]|uniref:hemolysin family protein n=1 Tax=Galbitalea sp. SE-J8 TaxID=3054952 RepID=UPI00259CA04C|nr:hemolysin family protein [Galbitalea sp. SE-J8]MDM4761826.1 hemolysin family protein [Galbitalea sp. SE-J8]